MIDSRAIFGPAIVYAATSALAAGVPLLILPVMTRVLSAAEYGIVAMFALVVSVFGSLAGLSIHGAIGVRYFERGHYDVRRYVGTCLIILATSAVFLAAVVWTGAEWLQSLTKISPGWLMIAVMIAAAQFVIQMRLVLWQCAGQPWHYGALRVAQAVIDASGSIVLVVALGLGWEGRLSGFAAATLIAAAIALGSLRLSGWLGARGDMSYFADALRFGLPLIPHTVGGLLLALVDRFMIANLLDIASAGVYMVAVQVGTVLAMLTDSFNKAYSPWLMKSLGEKSAQRDRAVVRFTYGCFLGLMAGALALGLAAPWLLGVLVGEEFRAAGPLIMYIAIGHAFTGMYLLVANYIFFAGRTASVALVSLTAGLFNAAASYWLIRHNGIAGAAQAFMAAQAVLFLGTWYFAQRARPMPWRAMFGTQ